MIAPSPVRRTDQSPSPARGGGQGGGVAAALVLRTGARAWRELRKMRTAIILLAILGLLAIIGTFLPQLPQNPTGVMGYVVRHPVTSPWFARLGLFDIFSSWPFIITAVLMYTSIGASMFIRIPAAWRRAMDPAQRNRGLGAEVASIIFHGSFFILLVGVIYGKAGGFLGNAAVVEGDSFVEARANYDNLSEGVLSTNHAGFQVKVDSFSASYWPSGAPKDFTSRVRIYDGGRLVESKSIQVNHYVDYQGIKIYQAGYGWAPTLKIETPDGRVVEDAPTIFVGDPQFANGVFKAPSAGPGNQQLGATAIFIPDPQISNQAIGPGTPLKRNPILLVRLYRGDLHLNRPQNVFALDTSNMDLRWRGALRVGDSVVTPDGYRLSFTGLKQYTDLTVNKDPGIPIVLAAFVIGLTALVISLYLPVMGPEQRLAPARELTG
ncbi:MAG TPA: cytochrome c biogenesis protein ResB [Candidatus Dormibacteraeota bacterium]|nr:cytochrome c biogenesis protein ResB [Candidatus Dormibacteraeota bacterium]